MRIVAFNGSPRGRASNTDRILQPFLEGAAQAGATVETVYMTDVEVRDCLGCFSCWRKTPGRCVLDDDGPALLEKMRGADLLVWATPLYHYGMTARLKRLLERTLPFSKPYIVKRGEHFLHPARYGDLPRKFVLIANCGFPERHHFSALAEQFRLLSGPDMEMAAAILCVEGELLGVPELAGRFKWYTDAARRAGREVVETGTVSPETRSVLERNLVPLESFVAMANASWSAPGERPPVLDEALRGAAGAEPATCEPPVETAVGETAMREPLAGQAAATPLAPPSGDGSMRDVIAGMALAFAPSRARGVSCTIQFDVGGEEPGQYFLAIADGRCTAYEGASPEADLVIHTPSEVWKAIAAGRLSGEQALLDGRYWIDGNLQTLVRMGEMFSPSTESRGESPAGPPGQSQSWSLADPSQACGGKPPESPAASGRRRPPGPLPVPGMMWLTVAFAPWVVYWAGSAAPAGAMWPDLVPLVLGLLILGYRLRYGTATWMDAGGPAFFAGSLVLSGVAPTFQSAYRDALSNMALAAIWMTTLAGDSPLTSEYSKWQYPPALERNPLFTRTNAIITAFWGLVFLVKAVVHLAAAADPARRLLWTVASNLLVVPAGAFTAWFSGWYPAYVATGGARRRSRGPDRVAGPRAG